MNDTLGSRPVTCRWLGLLTIASSAVYFLSDVLEAGNGGFTTLQLWLTLGAEATLPAFVVGLYWAQRPRIGRGGLYSVIAYASAYVYFTCSVTYALVHDVPDFESLNRELSPAMTLAGAVMVIAGIAFGFATYRACTLPRWTGPTLALGVVLVGVTFTLPAAVQLIAVGVRDLAFIGMGAALLRPTSEMATPEHGPAAGAPSQPRVAPGQGRADQIAARHGTDSGRAASWIDLYWLPLGAGGHCVRRNGRVYERLAAWHERRPAQDLYHAALEVTHAGRRYVIEMAPVWNEGSPDRGVVQEGPVGARWLGRFRAFRYEVRCWPDGRIPDVGEAVDSPQRLSDATNTVAALMSLIREVPALTWGRDQLGAGDMWNSNSLVAWLLASTGHDMTSIVPPAGGRAPGWSAGLQFARHEQPDVDRQGLAHAASLT